MLKMLLNFTTYKVKHVQSRDFSHFACSKDPKIRCAYAEQVGMRTLKIDRL
jgi:hypothetical protein